MGGNPNNTSIPVYGESNWSSLTLLKVQIQQLSHILFNRLVCKCVHSINK